MMFVSCSLRFLRVNSKPRIIRYHVLLLQDRSLQGLPVLQIFFSSSWPVWKCKFFGCLKVINIFEKNFMNAAAFKRPLELHGVKKFFFKNVNFSLCGNNTTTFIFPFLDHSAILCNTALYHKSYTSIGYSRLYYNIIFIGYVIFDAIMLL